MPELHATGEPCRVAMGGVQGWVPMIRGTGNPALRARAVRCTSRLYSHHYGKALQRDSKNLQRQAPRRALAFAFECSGKSVLRYEGERNHGRPESVQRVFV